MLQITGVIAKGLREGISKHRPLRLYKPSSKCSLNLLNNLGGRYYYPHFPGLELDTRK